MHRVAVIGLGRFGMELARSLGKSNIHVVAIDRTPQLINAVKDDVDAAVRLDSTDEMALASQELDKVDVAVVAIGENFEASLLTTVLLKKLGVSHIICRAQTTFHAEIFKQIGADEVIQPELHAGEHLARRLANPHLKDIFVLAEGYTIIELEAPATFHNQTLAELHLRAKYNVNLVAIRKRPAGDNLDEETIISVPRPDDVIEASDVLVVVGNNDALAQLPMSS